MSPTDPRTPCIIGVATHTWHPDVVGADGAPEPLEMWEHVSRLAERDAGKPGLLAALDSLQIVYCQTWEYDDAVARLAARVGAAPRHRHYSGIGGTTTQQLVNATSEAMLRGDMDLALITSAEALATKRLRKRDGGRYTASFAPTTRSPFPWESPPNPVEVAHEVFQAWLTFAVFDAARRAHLGIGLDDYRTAMGALLAPMTQIAAHNPRAWYRTARSAAEIIAARPDNRMVGYPYTKYMVAVMDVDMAGALLLATHERADDLGIPAERRIYPRGWCFARDPTLVAEHPDLAHSPAMGAASTEALRIAGLSVDDVTYFDLYSCFASSLHFACDALGIGVGDPRGVTVTGGLPYHGGPASGYLTHSIAEMVERLRSEPDAAGLVSGVGMHMTKHVFGVYRASPGPVEPPDSIGVQAAVDRVGSTAVVAQYDGDATVSAYSVVHGRDGSPEWALLVCDLPSGDRTYAQARAVELCIDAETTELVGRTVTLHPRTVDGPAGTRRVNLATW
ncbi:MAG TPA: acetyl-CoA synthetase [Acidimicrobiia bacterium]|nr:acetyl-CoA synthetase [Acidimicrobiia bacterium]